MTGLPDLSHARVVRALERAGFVIRKQGPHISMYNAERNAVAVVPRQNPVKSTTLARILREIGMSAEEFRSLL